MQWPERPTCHQRAANSPFFGVPIVWHEPEDSPNGRPFRSCSYCGSIHPEDLVKFLEAGGEPHQADWKFGYPHKFYIEKVPNPRAGEECEMGWRDQKPIMGPAPQYLFIKWYNDHLLDAGYDAEAHDKIFDALKPSGVLFFMQEGKLCYKTQKPGEPNAE